MLDIVLHMMLDRKLEKVPGKMPETMLERSLIAVVCHMLLAPLARGLNDEFSKVPVAMCPSTNPSNCRVEVKVMVEISLKVSTGACYASHKN